MPALTRIILPTPESACFRRIAREVVRGLQLERQVLERRMIDHAHQRLQPDVPLANLLVAVFVRAAGVLAVVEVDGFEPIQPDYAVEIRQHILQVVHDVVSRVADVARCPDTRRACHSAPCGR